jgi:alditol oxidase
MAKEFNWAGNHQYSTERLFFPLTVKEVQDLVQRHRKIKVLGTRHSFNGIADSTENLISLGAFEPLIEIESTTQTVTVGAGVRYGQLCRHLYSHGFALHNLGSLPHISVAGACVSATHGSGVKNGILATAVSAMEFIDANGNIVVLSREKDGEKFFGAVVNLGALGVVTKLKLDLHPTYQLRQDVFEDLPFSSLQDHLEDILSIGYSVSLFTDWKTRSFNQVWVKRRKGDGRGSGFVQAEFFGAKAATKNLHPIITMPAENCTEQMGVQGPWHERLPHFRMEFTPSNGEELQSEYFVPRDQALDAILSIEQIRQHLAPYVLISEIRTIDADQFWMSPCYKQPCVAIHFTWKQNWPAVKMLLPMIEERLAPFSARPHWSKLFTMEPAALQLLYKNLPDFLRLVDQYDPEGKFRNEFLERYIWGS